MSSTLIGSSNAIVSQPQSLEGPLTPGVVAGNWLTHRIQQAYQSSFNMCLSQLGWVPKSVLEVGFGDGNMLTYVAQTFLGAQIVGVEFDAETVAQAKERNCCSIQLLHVDQAEVLPFATGSFDLVISHGFLGNTPMPRHWLREMTRVSAEGIILSAPMPLGIRWLKKLPGSQRVQLLGTLLSQPDIQSIALKQLKTWVERMGCTVECTLTPLPYGMIMARKPQPGLL